MAIKTLNLKTEEQRIKDFKKFAVLNDTDMSKLLKAFIDDYTISVRHLVTQVEDLDAVRAHNLGEDPENAEGWVIVVSNVEDGKWMMRNDNCPMVEALDDFADKDLVYLACCHGDFIYAEMMNDNLKRFFMTLFVKFSNIYD